MYIKKEKIEAYFAEKQIYSRTGLAEYLDVPVHQIDQAIKLYFSSNFRTLRVLQILKHVEREQMTLREMCQCFGFSSVSNASRMIKRLRNDS